MKKLGSIFTIATMIVASTFGLTSCQQDDEKDNTLKVENEYSITPSLVGNVVKGNGFKASKEVADIDS